ncbi:hypothetical protein [Lentzea kentuckyensis]|uniref:hypothetical protein n=1 Tax=Lentzea kentuckyensis TaxID=360086 RepID=UPI000A3A60EC|nr:hypothetical protein [Lentzea kentuckyensis]
MNDDPHQSEPHQFDHSIRDGIFDGSADDIQDLDRDGFTDFNSFSRSRRRSGYHGYRDLSGAPSWVKVFVWAGVLLAIAGIGVVMFGVLSTPDAPEPFSTRLAPGITTFALPPGFPPDDLPVDLQPPAVTGFPSRPTPPSVGGPNLPLGFGLFFAGFVLAAIGALGHSTSTRR